MYQWANGDLLNNEALGFGTVAAGTFTSCASAQQIGMNYMTMPEITLSGCDATFTY